MEWKQGILQKPKLRTYAKIKHSFCAELYVKQTLSSTFLAQFSILPLELGTGRYTPIYDKFTKLNSKRHPSERLYTLCNSGLCEDEIHFLLICPVYRDLWQMLFYKTIKNFQTC